MLISHYGDTKYLTSATGIILAGEVSLNLVLHCYTKLMLYAEVWIFFSVRKRLHDGLDQN